MKKNFRDFFLTPMPLEEFNGHCLICSGLAERSGIQDHVYVKCRRCGEYLMSHEFFASFDLPNFALPAGWVNLSGWALDQQFTGGVPVLSREIYHGAASWRAPSLMERAGRVLQWFAKRNHYTDRTHTAWKGISDPLFLGASYSEGVADFDEVGLILFEQGLLFQSDPVYPPYYQNDQALITAKGLLMAEQTSRRLPRSSQGFVAMWFDDDMNDAKERGIKAGISASGYDPMLVNQVDHVGWIVDEILYQIRNSSFVVADFTGHRGGVYFEAGYALGLGIPVIWTCRKDHMDDLHFDIRQFNCIDWTAPDELALRLQSRIKNTVGLGRRHPEAQA